MLIACTGIHAETLHNGIRLFQLASRRRPWESHRYRVFASHRLFSVQSYRHRDLHIRRLPNEHSVKSYSHDDLRIRGYPSEHSDVKSYRHNDLRIHTFPVDPVSSGAKFYLIATDTIFPSPSAVKPGKRRRSLLPVQSINVRRLHLLNQSFLVSMTGRGDTHPAPLSTSLDEGKVER